MSFIISYYLFVGLTFVFVNIGNFMCFRHESVGVIIRVQQSKELNAEKP